MRWSINKEEREDVQVILKLISRELTADRGWQGLSTFGPTLTALASHCALRMRCHMWLHGCRPSDSLHSFLRRCSYDGVIAQVAYYFGAEVYHKQGEPQISDIV